MINEAGSVTLDSDMIPAMWSMLEIVSNKPQTDYGFADASSGDSTQLIFLRARWYNPADGRFQSRDTWEGDDKFPMSYNAWLYVYANPINATDPSGFITENQAKRAEVILEKLRSYGVAVRKDWGDYVTMSTIDPISTIRCGWVKGRWTLNELEMVKFAIKKADERMKGQFNSLIKPVEIIKDNKSPCGSGEDFWRGCTSSLGNKIWLKDNGKPSPVMWQKIIVDSSKQNFDVFSITHEIGHAWDQQNRQRLSAGLMDYTGGRYLPSGPRGPSPLKCDAGHKKPGCNAARYFYKGTPLYGAGDTFNAQEDFANSFAVYVFPNETQHEVQKKYSNLQNALHDYLYWELSDLHKMPRWLYIDHQINGTPLP